MFKYAEFIKSVFDLSDLPPPKYPEVAILGRSNAGKSSLINALLGHKKLARVSATPGFTKALNYYLIDRRFYLVDLPGYGYAKVSKEMRLRWKNLVEGYLRSIRDFRLLILIFDVRRVPDDLDLSLLSFVRSLRKPFHVVLNKIDLLEEKELQDQIKTYHKVLSLNDENISLISCVKRRGLSAVKSKIEGSLFQNSCKHTLPS